MAVYNAKIVTEAGKIVRLGYDYGIIFDITPISGADVELEQIRGFSQVGESISNQSVEGVTRLIHGVILHNTAAKNLLSSVPVFTRGKLYLNDNHYCEFVAQSTPQLNKSKTGKTTFTMRIRCTSPFWLASKRSYCFFNKAKAEFMFPTSLNNHVFGTVASDIIMNAHNEGDVACDAVFRFAALGEVKGYGIKNIATGEVIEFSDTLAEGDEVEVYSSGGRVFAKKITAAGDEGDNIFYLTDNSTLFKLAAGSNYLQPYVPVPNASPIAEEEAEEMRKNLRVSVSFNAAYMGVVV